MLPVEFYGRHVLQTRMRSHLVVMTAPVLDQDTGLLSRSGPLLVQTLIAKPPIEALIGAVVPGLAGVVQRGLDTRFSDPAITDPRVLPSQSPHRIDHGLLACAARTILSTYQCYKIPGRSEAGLRGQTRPCAAHEKGRGDLAKPLLPGMKANLVAFRVQEVREEPKVIAYLCFWHHHSSTCLLHSRKQWR